MYSAHTLPIQCFNCVVAHCTENQKKNRCCEPKRAAQISQKRRVDKTNGNVTINSVSIMNLYAMGRRIVLISRMKAISLVTEKVIIYLFRLAATEVNDMI